MKKVTGTYFNFINSKLTNVNFIAGRETRLINFRNCEFTDTSVHYEKDGPEVNVVIENCKGDLRESGPGLKTRKVTR